MKKVLVLGLDGANWNLIDPWISEGSLPNLKMLKNVGVWGDLRSCLPPVTCPNWKCYSTGKNPGNLGVYWWERIDCKNKKLILPSSLSFHSKEIWDYLNMEGYNTGIINMPTTYPPKKVNGFMIAGGPTSSEEKFCYPEELEKMLYSKYGYRVHPKHLLTSNSNQGKEVDEILNLIDLRFNVAFELLQDYDLHFLHITIFYLNVLQHYFWRGEPVKRAWEIIDHNIGKFLKDDVNLFLHSDHGSHPVNTVFYINSWLQKEGYLLIKKNSKDFFLQLGLSKQKVFRFSKKLGIEWLLKVIPKTFKNILPKSEEGFKRKEKLERVNWEKTNAIASGQGLIYLNCNQSYHNTIRNKIMEKLKSLKSPITGENITEKVFKKEEIYNGNYLDLAPDIIFEQAKGVHTTDVIGHNQIFSSTNNWKADNIPMGLFCAYGPDIKKRGILSGLSILDIAPTILYLMNVSIPRDMEGRVLNEIFEE